MPLDEIQQKVCAIITAAVKESPGGYFAGGGTLQEVLQGDRYSGDIDRFHDSDLEVKFAFERDSKALSAAGFRLEVISQFQSFIRAKVSDDSGRATILDWAKDSAYRFFPLEETPGLGRSLSPFDLATNKTLAMVGRLEVSDWLDMMLCHDRLQPLGCLAFAACGKDPGFSPGLIVEMGARCTRYAKEELALIRFRSKPPSLAALHRKWHKMIDEARAFLEILPPAEAGTGVMLNDVPFNGTLDDCRAALAAGNITFRPGRLETVIGIPKPALVYPGPPDFGPTFEEENKVP